MKSVSGKELCKVVEKKGWILKRINGSHHIFKKAGVEHLLVIPVHKNQDIKQGLLRSIMKLADISDHELQKENDLIGEVGQDFIFYSFHKFYKNEYIFR